MSWERHSVLKPWLYVKDVDNPIPDPNLEERCGSMKGFSARQLIQPISLFLQLQDCLKMAEPSCIAAEMGKPPPQSGVHTAWSRSYSHIMCAQLEDESDT
jgi:hypothetical protein